MKRTHHPAVKLISNILGTVHWQNLHERSVTFKWNIKDSDAVNRDPLAAALKQIREQFPTVKIRTTGIARRYSVYGCNLRVLIPRTEFDH